MDVVSYSDSVEALRHHPAYDVIIEQSYLDEDTLAAARRFAASEEFAAIKTLLRLPRSCPVSILDVGCGNGIASYAFSRLGASVVALDPDSSPRTGLDAARSLIPQDGEQRFKLCCAASEVLPFGRESFDIVYARQALHHFSDLRAGLAECARVLRRNGLFLACREHVVSNERERLEFLQGHPLHALHGRENAYRDEDYRSELQAAGLRVVQALGPYDSVVNHYPVGNADIDCWLRNALSRRLGSRVGTLLAASPLVQRLYRSRLSDRCSTPGRMHSYLCLK